MAFRLGLVFAVLAGRAWAQQTQAEIDLLKQAEQVVQSFCPVDFAPLNYAQAYANLYILAGEDNPLYQTVLDSRLGDGVNTNVFLENLEKNLDVTYIVTKAFAFVFLVILLILWIGGCWCFLIPPCMRCCCRCCEMHHELGKHRRFHILLWVLFAGLSIGCIVAQAISFPSYNDVDQGVQGTACYSAQLVRDVVNGNEGLDFVGLLPAADTLQTLAGLLEPESPVMTEIHDLLNLTADIQKAVTFNLAILNQLSDLVRDPANLEPGDDMMHKCQICGPLGELTSFLLSKIETGAQMALFLARLQVEQQLRGPELTNLRQSVRDTVEPLEHIKAGIVDNIGFFLSTAEGGFHQIMGYIRGDFWSGQGGYLFPFICILFVLCLWLVIHGIFSLVVFNLCGGGDHDKCFVRESAGHSICSFYCYTMFLFLLGGIMVIVTSVSSGVCMVMFDFDRQVGEQLMVSLGFSEAALEGGLGLALNVTDQCMSLKVEPNGTTDLADMIPIPNPRNPGQTTTPRKVVYEEGIVPIEAAFKELEKYQGMIPKLADSAEANAVLKVVGDINMRSLIWADPTKILASERYRAMNPAYYLVTLNCADSVLSTDLPAPLGGTLVPGMDSIAISGFLALELEENIFKAVLPGEHPNTRIQVHGLESDMAQPIVWTCPVPGFAAGTCGTSSSSNLGTEAACVAGKRFLEEKKLPLVVQPVFRCRYFQLPGAPWGTACDISNMSFQDTPCFYPNGSMETFTKSCTLDEFSAQISDFQYHLHSGLRFLDDTVEGVATMIKETLRRLIYEHVVNPILNVMNNLDCDFMRHFWTGLTSSLCLRTVGGFHTMSVGYLVAGILSFLVAGVMYVPWRVSRDNTDVWRSEQEHAHEDAEGLEGDAEAPATEGPAALEVPAAAPEAARPPRPDGSRSISL